MSDDVLLPPRINQQATLEDLARTVAQLQDYIQAREPTAFGGRLDKFLTVGDTVQAGLLAYQEGGAAGGAATDGLALGPGSSNPADATPPAPISGLTVAAGVGHHMVEWDAPVYQQGGGNGRTIIYAANYSGAGPLPTFGDAVEVGTAPGRATLLIVASEPGVQVHFWAKAETRHPTLQAAPTGGTNGVTSTADLIDNQHIIKLSAGKLTAGTIGVSEYIESTGYSPGLAGWRIRGDGVAEFSGVLVRGTIYASAGSIGGNAIDATGMQSPGYTAGSTGWRLDTSGLVRAFGAAGARVLDLAATGVNPVLKVGSVFEVLADGTATFAGALAAATGTFSGVLTASAINAVDTINLAGQAVTIPTTAYSVASVACPATTLTDVQTVSWTSTGAPVFVAATVGVDWLSPTAATCQLTVVTNTGTTLWSGYFQSTRLGMSVLSFTMSWLAPPAGAVSLTLKAYPSLAIDVFNRNLLALETKR